MTQRALVWIRNDQRLLDNEIVSRACKMPGPNAVLYCFDPRHFTTTDYGSQKTAAFRAKFLVESIADLRSNLQRVGADLLVGLGKPEDIIPKVASSLLAGNSAGADRLAVLAQKEYAWEEACVEKAVSDELFKMTGQGKKLELKTYDGATLYNRDDLPFKPDLSDLKHNHTDFIRKTDHHAACIARDLFPTPKKGELKVISSEDFTKSTSSSGALPLGYDFLPTEQELGFKEGTFAKIGADPQAVMQFQGGETTGRARVEQWMFKGDNLKTYFDTRNGMLGEAASSKFSPWLANGNLSPRFIKFECDRYEKERRISNKSTYWLVYEMLVRDYMHFLVQKGGKETFWSGGISGQHGRKWDNDEAKIKAWKTGMTGVPLVDANMRELAATGWMSNRGRQNVASYLINDLGLDWRVGADHFESLLLDHDVYSNYGNWNSAAGLTGGRINRFNMTKQSNDYDPEGAYVKHWIPEIRQVLAPSCFNPPQALAPEYPRPIANIRSGFMVKIPADKRWSADERSARRDARDAKVAGGSAPDTAERHWQAKKDRPKKSRLQ